MVIYEIVFICIMLYGCMDVICLFIFEFCVFVKVMINFESIVDERYRFLSSVC